MTNPSRAQYRIILDIYRGAHLYNGDCVLYAASANTKSSQSLTREMVTRLRADGWILMRAGHPAVLTAKACRLIVSRISPLKTCSVDDALLAIEAAP